MKRSDLRKILYVIAVSLMPMIAVAGGTNTDSSSSTGYKKDPDKTTRQGEMGSTDVTTKNSPARDASPSVKVDDATLRKQVEDALKSDALLSKTDIRVDVHNGIVNLSGDVKDIRWKGQAVKVASSIPGIKSVQNNLMVGDEKHSSASSPSNPPLPGEVQE